MASKMLVDRSNSTPSERPEMYYCVPCGSKTQAMQDGDLEHETEVGDEVCIICEQRIADLPEPPTYQYDVALHVTLVVSLKASSPVEAQAVAFDALNIQGEGVTSWKCTAQENFIIDEEEP